MKTLLILLFVVLLFACNPGLSTAELAAPGTPARKFQRGLLNMALSPIEISHELDKEKKRDTFLPSWVSGIMRGSFFAAGRAFTGAVETLTFFAPFPAGFSLNQHGKVRGPMKSSSFPDHYAPLIQPEFPSDHLPQDKA